MQTSKILLALGAALAFSLSVNADDSDAQAKARQALEQQLNRSPSAPPQPATPAPPPAKKAPAAPAMVPPPAAAPAAPPPSPDTQADDQSIAKAREAMHQKINELATEPAPRPPAVAAAAAAAAPKVVPPPATETGTSPMTGSETGASPEEIAKARAAMRQRVADLPAEQPEPGSANEAAIAKAREAMYDKMQQLPPYTGGESFGQASQEFPPLEAPELPISGAKVQKLHALLQQYKADQITPEQYQAERAKILAAAP